MNDVNNLDRDDIGLKGIFGDRFYDATQQPTAAKEPRKTINIPYEAKAAQKPVNKPTSANKDRREPIKPEPNWMDRLKSCVKWAAPYGFLSILIFYWQQANLMDISIAQPCMCVCTLMAGYGIGKNALMGVKR